MRFLSVSLGYQRRTKEVSSCFLCPVASRSGSTMQKGKSRAERGYFTGQKRNANLIDMNEVMVIYWSC